jgi:organic radical activating enzyme
MRRLTLAEIEDARWKTGDSALLFITDRCPVGCRHCSVDSRPDSPRITDFGLFQEVVAGLAAGPFSIIGISGGEPFVERRGLVYAVDQLTGNGKDILVYTSGFWAVKPHAPGWINAVLDRCGSVFLSTDAFHQAAISGERFKNAARAIAAREVPIVVQVLDVESEIAHAAHLLNVALGQDWMPLAEIKPIPMLPYGRAAALFSRSATRAAADFGPCEVARAPVIRYDGIVHACCNESVLLGGGPNWLRRRVRTRQDFAEAVSYYRESPLLQTIARAGVGTLTQRPLARDLESHQFSSICGACWKLVRRLTVNGEEVQ